MVENPFRSETPPFAGREGALARLHQQLIDPNNRFALLFIGQRYSGKTALLKMFFRVFDETYLGVYLPLPTTPLDDETVWLRTLYGAAREVLLDAGMSRERVLELPDYDTNLREWLSQTAMPRIVQGLRGGRQLVFLLDDADCLIEAITAKRLPADTPAYLQSLLLPKIDFVLTLNTDYEDRLRVLYPLINPPDAYRLHYLTRDEFTELYPGPDMAIVEQVAEKAYRLIGGHPALAQRLGDLLWQRTGSRMMSPEDVSAVVPEMYSESTTLYRQLWQELTLNERLVLTALSSLLYADPLKPVSPEQIEAWLVETDYQLDLTAIHAAIRGLEYREIVGHERGGLVLISGLLQKWLLENARVESPPTIASRPERVLPQQGHRALWIAIGAAVILFVLVMTALLLNTPPSPSTFETIPTITLASDLTAIP
jgi:hypothetical protein